MRVSPVRVKSTIRTVYRSFLGVLPVRHGLFYRRVFKPAVAAALLADKQALRWHDLRHTCASLSLAVAPNLHVVMLRLGHASAHLSGRNGDEIVQSP